VGGSVNVTNVNSFGSNVSRNEIAAALALSEAKTKSDILRSMRMGGTFAGAG
jgi:hypothetical protein